MTHFIPSHGDKVAITIPKLGGFTMTGRRVGRAEELRRSQEEDWHFPIVCIELTEVPTLAPWLQDSFGTLLKPNNELVFTAHPECFSLVLEMSEYECLMAAVPVEPTKRRKVTHKAFTVHIEFDDDGTFDASSDIATALRLLADRLDDTGFSPKLKPGSGTPVLALDGTAIGEWEVIDVEGGN